MRALDLRSLDGSSRPALAAAVAGCALKPPPTSRRTPAVTTLPHTTIAARMEGSGRQRRRRSPSAGWRRSTIPALSALVDEALVYNADLQRGGGARRAGDRLCGGGERRSLPVGGTVGHQERQVGRRRRTERGLPQRVPRARRLGTPALRAGRGARRNRRPSQADFAYARQSLAATGGQELVRGHRSGTAARAREETRALVGGAACVWRRIGCASASGNEQAVARSATPASAAIATRCARSSRRASRHCARSSFCWAAIRRRRSRSRSACRRCLRRCPPGCRRSSSSAART